MAYREEDDLLNERVARLEEELRRERQERREADQQREGVRPVEAARPAPPRATPAKSELPPRTEQTMTVEMSETERAFYEALRQKALDNISAMDAPTGRRKGLS